MSLVWLQYLGKVAGAVVYQPGDGGFAKQGACGNMPEHVRTELGRSWSKVVKRLTVLRLSLDMIPVDARMRGQVRVQRRSTAFAGAGDEPVWPATIRRGCWEALRFAPVPRQVLFEVKQH